MTTRSCSKAQWYASSTRLPTPVRPIDIERNELIGRVPGPLRTANGIPEPERVADHQRAVALASEALADLLYPNGVRTSPLGPGWSRDIDLHLRAWPDPTRLKDLGWVHLDALLNRLGSPSKGKWAVVEDGRVMAGLELHLSLPPDPVASLIKRCWRRGEVRIREVLEARELLRSGHALPPDEPIIRRAARVEAGLGGHELARWNDGPPLEAPSPLAGFRFHQLWRTGRSALRPRLVIAISGVDGAGKSTLSSLIVRQMEQAGVPACRVWARPGMRGRWLNSVSRVGRRLFGRNPVPKELQVARGMPLGPRASRQGIIGWTWVTLLTFRFLATTLRQHIEGRGVLVYDRHVLDALATFDTVYEGVDTRMHRAVVRRVFPKPALSLYLDVPAEVARARKPEDIFEEVAIRRQLERYEVHSAGFESLYRLDACSPTEELAATVLLRLTSV